MRWIGDGWARRSSWRWQAARRTIGAAGGPAGRGAKRGGIELQLPRVARRSDACSLDRRGAPDHDVADLGQVERSARVALAATCASAARCFWWSERARWRRTRTRGISIDARRRARRILVYAFHTFRGRRPEPGPTAHGPGSICRAGGSSAASMPVPVRSGSGVCCGRIQLRRWGWRRNCVMRKG